jgi:hypothetical protein
VGTAEDWRLDRERLAEAPGWELRPCLEIGTVAFYDKRQGAEQEAALWCWGCPVLAECREYALRWESFGVWGGMTEHQRREVNAERRRKARAAETALAAVAVEEAA